MVETVRSHLEEHGLSCQVTGRAKSPYSIYKKMSRTGCKVEDINDLLAFRVIVEDLSTCYASLGLLHAHMPPVPDRIKDYIARAKPNGYQSLHTTVIGPEERRVEIQIRTRDMDRIADEGIAAHWRYKEGHLALKPDDVLRISRIRELFETARETADAAEFMEAVKVELYADEVFVFTPVGDVKRLPMGATALDFAYAVHSQVGNRCNGARVNGKLVPLRHELKSGDTVEIMTSETQSPQPGLAGNRANRAERCRKFGGSCETLSNSRGCASAVTCWRRELRRHGWSVQRVQRDGPACGMCCGQREHKRTRTSCLVEVARGQEALRQPGDRDLLPDGEYQDPNGEPQQNALSSLLNRFRQGHHVAGSHQR